MRKIVFLFLVVAQISYSQVNFVPVDHKIYSFLERMSVANFITNYNSFEIPKSGKEIGSYLSEIDKTKLSAIDKAKLDDFLDEFQLEITGETNNIQSIIENPNSSLTRKTRFFYFNSDNSNNNLYVKLLGETKFISQIDDKKVVSATPFKFGGEIGGTFSNNFGFQIQGINGSFFGEKSILLKDSEYNDNYKFNLPDSQAGSSFYDETRGSLIYQDQNFIFRFGRDRIKLGYGNEKSVLGENAPIFDFAQMQIKYNIFNFSYLHAKLIQDENPQNETKRDVLEKYFVFHRLSAQITKNTNFSLGELAIYSNRGIDLSYVNPFVFFKSIEHYNQDRDNTILFTDIKIDNLLNFMSFYGSLFVDDMDFGKIGSGWYGNKTMWDFGISFIPSVFESDFFSAQYIHIEPYFYTHHLFGNNFTHFDKLLNDNLMPNSELFGLLYQFSVTRDLDFEINYKFYQNGKNTLDENGEVEENVGGDINFGHRTEDATKIHFLQGDVLTRNSIKITSLYNFLRYYEFLISAEYFNEDFLIENSNYVELRTSLKILL